MLNIRLLTLFSFFLWILILLDVVFKSCIIFIHCIVSHLWKGPWLRSQLESLPSFFVHSCLLRETKGSESQELCASVLKLWRVVCCGNGTWIIELAFFCGPCQQLVEGQKQIILILLQFFIKVCCSGANQDSLIWPLFKSRLCKFVLKQSIYHAVSRGENFSSLSADVLLQISVESLSCSLKLKLSVECCREFQITSDYLFINSFIYSFKKKKYSSSKCLSNTDRRLKHWRKSRIQHYTLK